MESPETEMVRMSVPLPPLRLSPALIVVPVAASAMKAPTKVSAPAVLAVPAEPTRTPDVSALVVSDLFCTQNGVNTHLFYLYFDIRPDIDSITTIDHQ